MTPAGIRPADRVIIAVSGSGGAALATGAHEAGARVLYPVSIHSSALGDLARALAEDAAHATLVTVVAGCTLTAMRHLVHHGAHAVVCPPAADLHLYDEYVDPVWVWENHTSYGAALARQAQRYLSSGLATTLDLRTAL